MRPYVCLFALIVLCATGCSRDQQVDAGQRARQAGTQIEKATQGARESLTDATITGKVKAAMSASDRLNTAHIDVDTRDRVVHLRGHAKDAQQKALAERIAKDTVGTDVSVVNELAIGAMKK